MVRKKQDKAEANERSMVQRLVKSIIKKSIEGRGNGNRI